MNYWLYAIHPAWMWVVFVYTLYLLYLGLQIRRTRAANGDLKRMLVKQKFGQRHHQLGALLLALMATASIGVLGVEYINSGEIYVVPHTLVGLSMTVLMASAAAFAPLMTKGENWARYAHVMIALIITTLFGWQVITGVEIILSIVNGE